MDGHILRAPISHIYPSVGYCVVNLGQGLTTTFNQMNGSQLHTFFVYINEISGGVTGRFDFIYATIERITMLSSQTMSKCCIMRIAAVFRDWVNLLREG